MTHLIDKSALVAEIDKRIADNKKEIERASHKNLEDYFEGYEDALALLKQQYLDTLEVKEVQEEPVSNDLEGAAREYVTKEGYLAGLHYNSMVRSFMAGAEWQRKNLWRPADGDDLPEIDREVIALVGLEGFFEIPPDEPVKLSYKVVFAHRPPEYWDGKNILTGEVTRHYTKRYDKGGWNIPNVKYWLDCSMPKVKEG